MIMATGGLGRIYRGTTNAYACTGDGMSMAWRAGVPLKDMEFMQFHPTTLKANGVLITEGCRGEGGYLRNAEGERFMFNYAPNAGELAAATWSRVRSRRRSTRAAASTAACCSTSRTWAPSGSSSACTAPASWPWTTPASTRSRSRSRCGRARTTTWAASTPTSGGRTIMPGLYAAGECACVSVHGANRLGGNSLLETVVFGRRSGASAAQDVRSQRARRRVLAVRRAGSPSAHPPMLDNIDGERPHGCARSWPMPCTRTPASSAPPRSWRPARRTVEELRERYAAA